MMLLACGTSDTHPVGAHLVDDVASGRGIVVERIVRVDAIPERDDAGGIEEDGEGRGEPQEQEVQERDLAVGMSRILNGEIENRASAAGIKRHQGYSLHCITDNPPAESSARGTHPKVTRLAPHMANINVESRKYSAMNPP